MSRVGIDCKFGGLPALYALPNPYTGCPIVHIKGVGSPRWLLNLETYDMTELRTHGTLKCSTCGHAVHFATLPEGLTLLFPWSPYNGWLVESPHLPPDTHVVNELVPRVTCPDCRERQFAFARRLFGGHA